MSTIPKSYLESMYLDDYGPKVTKNWTEELEHYYLEGRCWLLKSPESILVKELKLYCLKKYGSWWATRWWTNKQVDIIFNTIMSTKLCAGSVMCIVQRPEEEWYDCLLPCERTKYFIKMSSIILNCNPLVKISRKV